MKAKKARDQRRSERAREEQESKRAREQESKRAIMQKSKRAREQEGKSSEAGANEAGQIVVDRGALTERWQQIEVVLKDSMDKHSESEKSHDQRKTLHAAL